LSITDPASDARADSGVDRTPFDDDLSTAYQYWLKSNDHTGDLMYKFTLPQSEAATMLDLLAKREITGARLFPGYAGVVAMLKESTLIRRARSTG